MAGPSLVALAYAALLAVVLGLVDRHAGVGLELGALGLTLGFPLLLLVIAAHAAACLPRHGVLALAPVLLLLAGVPSVAGVRSADASLHDRRFRQHLAEVEGVLVGLPLGSGDRLRLPLDSLPRRVRDCCTHVWVRRDQEGRLSAFFLDSRDTAYLYDPSGARLRRAVSARRWRSYEQVAPAWYRIVRYEVGE